MAWDFAAQIHALTGFDADDTSGTTETDEVFSDMATQWLTDAAKEVINVLPPNLLKLCSSEQTFTSQAVGSESSASTLNTGKVLSVFAGNYEAREIKSSLKHKANDSNSLEYASTTDPVFYTENNYLNVLPASISCKYEEVQYPSVTYSLSSISNFPDEAEHLVVIKAAITSLEYLLAVEEDVELYSTMIANLRTEYMQGVNALKTNNLTAPKEQAK
tara:strand:+ start:108 stop:758 length:651 start_codon:yes stop_codon:yes gene_type:complete